MEEQVLSEIKEELEFEVQGKEQWLKSIITEAEILSQEITSISLLSEKLFFSYNKAAFSMQKLVNLINLPAFINDFCKYINHFADLRLPYKLQEISIKLAKWNKKVKKSLEICEQRNHCRNLYEKIISETSKITQNYRIQEMDSIKEECWTTYLIKHKEFISNLQDLDTSIEKKLAGPISEMISTGADFMYKHAEMYNKAATGGKGSKAYLENLEKHKNYKVSVKYRQENLQHFNNSEENFNYIRSRIRENNCEVVQKYKAISNNELTISSGDSLEIKYGDFHEHWCRGVNNLGQKGFVPSNSVRVYKFGKISTEIEDDFHVEDIKFEEFLGVCNSHIKYLEENVEKSKEKLSTIENFKILVRLLSKYLDIAAITKVFMQEILSEIPDSLEKYLIYLTLYLDAYKLISKLLQKVSEDTKKALKLQEALEEFKCYLNAVQKLVYKHYHISRAKSLLETLEIVTSVLLKVSKPICILPKAEQVIAFLQDPKNINARRVTVQQNSLIIVKEFLLFASVPFKINTIVPLKHILDTSVSEEVLKIHTNRKEIKFTFDNSKRAADWMGEIDNIVQSIY